MVFLTITKYTVNVLVDKLEVLHESATGDFAFS